MLQQAEKQGSVVVVVLPVSPTYMKEFMTPEVTKRYQEALALAQKNLESVTLVTDDEAVTALTFILERLKVLTEPAASCTLAAARRLKENFGPDNKVVLIFCGGNQSLSDICGYLK